MQIEIDQRTHTIKNGTDPNGFTWIRTWRFRLGVMERHTPDD